jgi:hypothetical protein
MARLALAESSFQTLQTDAQKRALIRLSIGLVPFAGIAFTISVSTAALRTAALPRWVSSLGYLIALVLLVAAGEHRWTQLAFPSWVLLVSLVILFVRPPNRTRAVEVGPDSDTETGAP